MISSMPEMHWPGSLNMELQLKRKPFVQLFDGNIKASVRGKGKDNG